MSTERVTVDPDRVDGERSKTTLHIEMHSSQRQLLTSFREQFMRWVNDRGPTGFARHAGVPQRISFEQGQSDDGDRAAMMSLDLVWSTRPPSNVASAQLVPSSSVSPATSSPLSTRTDLERHQKFVFFPDLDSEVPRHHGAQLLGPVAFRPGTSRTAGKQIHRPVMLELMHQAMATTVRTYRRLRLKPERPSRVQMVRVLLPRSPLTPANTRSSALRTGGFFFAVASATLLLVITASRASHILAATQRARSAPTSHAQSRPPEIASLAARSTSGITDRSIKDLAATSVPLTFAWAILRAPVTQRDVEAPSSRTIDRRPPPSERAVVRSKSVTTAPVHAPARIAPVSVVAESTVVGTLVVDSEPSGAMVSINGVTHGNTPLEIENLSVGTRVIRVELPGYERWSWAVNVVANKRTPVTAKLQPEARRLGASN